MHSTRMGTHRTRATFLRLLRLPPPQPQLLLLCSLLPAPIDALIGMHASQRWRRRALNADERFDGASFSRSLPSSPSPPSSSSSSSSK